jgi:hypothetical protein
MKISIPKPCSENWNQMNPSEKGRFCTSCQTQVINFKGMPVEEIKHFLEQNTGSTCGRFSTEQIETFNAAYQELPSPSSLRRWTMAAVLAGVSVMPTFAQDNNSTIATSLPSATSYYHNQPQTAETTAAVPTGDTVILVGQVLDSETGEELPFVSIFVEGTKIGTTTDFDGNFLLKVPKSKEAIMLVISYVGYPTLSHSILPDSTKTNLIFKMNLGFSTMGITIGGIMPISKKEQRAYNRAHKKELREERKRERIAKKEQNL